MLERVIDKRPQPDRLLVAEIYGEARHRARWRDLTSAEECAAAAELRTLAGGRADLLAEVAGIFEGAREGELDEPLARQAAGLCRKAGADEEAIPAWIAEGRRRRAAADQPPSSGRRAISGVPCKPLSGYREHELVTGLRQVRTQRAPPFPLPRHPIGRAWRWGRAGEGACTLMPSHRAGNPMEPPAGPPSGWYLDPNGQQVLRWWDGMQWGPHTQPLPAPQERVLAPQPGTAPYGAGPGPTSASSIQTRPSPAPGPWAWTVALTPLVMLGVAIAAAAAAGPGGSISGYVLLGAVVANVCAIFAAWLDTRHSGRQASRSTAGRLSGAC